MMHDKYVDVTTGAVPLVAVQEPLERPMRPVVGLDLSLTGTGVTVINAGVHTALFGAKGHKSDTLQMRADRLDTLFSQIVNVIPEHALVVIEQPAYSSVGGSHHDRSGLWWIIVHHLYQFHDIAEVPPSTLKKYAVGKGGGPGATKGAVIEAVTRRYPDVSTGGDDNICDSFVLAAMGSRHLGRPLEESLPQTHLAAMDAVRWPNPKGTK